MRLSRVLIFLALSAVFIGLGTYLFVWAFDDLDAHRVAILQKGIPAWTNASGTNNYLKFSNLSLAASTQLTCGNTVSNKPLTLSTANLDVYAKGFPDYMEEAPQYPQRRYSGTNNITINTGAQLTTCSVNVQLTDTNSGRIVASESFPYSSVMKYGENSNPSNGRYCPARLEKCTTGDPQYLNCWRNCAAAGGQFNCDLLAFKYFHTHTCTITTYATGACIKLNVANGQIVEDAAYPYAGTGCAAQPFGVVGLPRVDQLANKPSTTFSVTVRSAFDPFLSYFLQVRVKPEGFGSLGGAYLAKLVIGILLLVLAASAWIMVLVIPLFCCVCCGYRPDFSITNDICCPRTTKYEPMNEEQQQNGSEQSFSPVTPPYTVSGDDPIKRS